MPQGRRKTPFSGKAKKEQLKLKKQSKTLGSHKTFEGEFSGHVQKVNFQKLNNTRTNRYALHFYSEIDADIREQKKIAYEFLKATHEKDLEISIDDYFSDKLDFPKRPQWSFTESVQKLESKEHQYFTDYIDDIKKKFENNWKQLGYFELNLETWRQLWRVLEMSDIILVIVDIRYAALMFPPLLYEYVVQTLNKDMLLVLNKVDLAPTELVTAWKFYFQEKYPKLHILLFTAFPKYNMINKQSHQAGLKFKNQRRKLRMASEGTQLLFDACKSIIGDDLDLLVWQEKIREEMLQEHDVDDTVKIEKVINVERVDTQYFKHEKYKNGVLTLGCVGQPNAGKSSIINAIMGKKVVSVSKTPGHTKHFQTIFVTKNVKLCDCPGLVFPSMVPKALQVLMGSFPIAQLREPFTSIKYLAEHLNLPQLLKLQHDDDDEEEEWSAMTICEAWAKKRGFLTAKAARLDSHRAANNLLRFALDGKICLCMRPPDFLERKEYWKNHPDSITTQWVQGIKSEEAEPNMKKAESLHSDEDTDYSSSTDSKDECQESSDSSDQHFATNKFAVLVDNE